MNLFTFLVGLAFGFVIVATGLSDYTVIHDMLLLREPDVFLLMGSSFAVAMPLLWIFRRRSWKTPLGGESNSTASRTNENTFTGELCSGRVGPLQAPVRVRRLA